MKTLSLSKFIAATIIIAPAFSFVTYVMDKEFTQADFVAKYSLKRPIRLDSVDDTRTIASQDSTAKERPLQYRFKNLDHHIASFTKKIWKLREMQKISRVQTIADTQELYREGIDTDRSPRAILEVKNMFEVELKSDDIKKLDHFNQGHIFLVSQYHEEVGTITLFQEFSDFYYVLTFESELSTELPASLMKTKTNQLSSRNSSVKKEQVQEAKSNTCNNLLNPGEERVSYQVFAIYKNGKKFEKDQVSGSLDLSRSSLSISNVSYSDFENPNLGASLSLDEALNQNCTFISTTASGVVYKTEYQDVRFMGEDYSYPADKRLIKVSITAQGDEADAGFVNSEIHFISSEYVNIIEQNERIYEDNNRELLEEQERMQQAEELAKEEEKQLAALEAQELKAYGYTNDAQQMNGGQAFDESNMVNVNPTEQSDFEKNENRKTIDSMIKDSGFSF